MASLIADSSLYKVVLWILGISLAASVVVVVATVILYLNAALKLNRQQLLGKRLEEACGKEVTERETERYYIYNVFVENTLRNKITSVIALLRSTMGIIIVSMVLVYGFWMWLILQGQGGVSPYTNKWDWWNTNKAYSRIFLGWIPFGVLAMLLLTGAAGTWVAAADAKSYSKKLLGSDEAKTVTELLADLKKRAPGIRSPWFPLALLIFYGVVWTFVTSTFITGEGGSGDDNYGKRVESLGVTLWMSLVLLYIFMGVAVMFVEKDTRNLFATVQGMYSARARKLQQEINELFSSTNKTLKQNARKYFKTWIETVMKGTEVAASTIKNDDTSNSKGEYDDHLWKFIQHRNGKEMEDIYNLDTADDNRAAGTLIDGIRDAALKVRMAGKPMSVAAKKFTRNAVISSSVIIVLILFALFNALSRAWSSTHMVVASLSLIFAFTVVSTWFGWFSSALLL